MKKNNIKRRYEVKYPKAPDWVPVDESIVHYIFTVVGYKTEPVFCALHNGEVVKSPSGSQYRERPYVCIDDYSSLGAGADVSHALVGMG